MRNSAENGGKNTKSANEPSKETAINAKRRKAFKEKKSKTSLISLTSVSAIESEIQAEEKSSKFRLAKSRQRQKIASCLSSMPDNPMVKAAAIEAGNKSAISTDKNFNKPKTLCETLPLILLFSAWIMRKIFTC